MSSPCSRPRKQLQKLLELAVEAVSVAESCRNVAATPAYRFRQVEETAFSAPLHKLISALLSLVQTMLPYSFSQKTFDVMIMGLASSIETLIACTQRSSQTLRLLRDQVPNHFGVYRPSIYLEELEMFGSEISRIIACDTGQCGSGDFGKSAESRLLTSVESDIQNIAARLWWTRFFSHREALPSWEEFSEHFQKTFGSQHSETMEKFRIELVYDGVVTMKRYNDVSKKYGGLYEAFQHISDPERLVYVMGEVDDDPNTPISEPRIVQSLLGVNVTQVCCGGQHAACLSSSGRIYTWGRGGFGRLGHGGVSHIAEPRLLESLSGTPCSQVACGFAYTAAVTCDGTLYTWGAGENGRLGLGDAIDRYSPSCVETLRYNVKEVFAGSVHTCVLGKDECVYSFGKHEYTGHASLLDVLIPRKLDAFNFEQVCQISVGPGGYHTIALTKSGAVYTWGHNRVGQLGCINTDVIPRNIHGAYFIPEPRLVDSLSSVHVQQVVAGWGHTAALDSTGHVYICGRNVQGQLGLGHPSNSLTNERGHAYQAGFQRISSLGDDVRVTQIACGGEHSVAIASDGSIYTFGAGNRGQLGHGDNVNQHFPSRVSKLADTRRKMLDVSCGNNCTLVLAGNRALPSLYEMCHDVIHSFPKLKAMLDDEGVDMPEVRRHSADMDYDS